MDHKFFIRNLWKWKCGLPEENKPQVMTLSNLEESEWSIEFERLMRNRLAFGSFRYGVMHGKDKPNWNRVESIRKRLKLYEDTGNTEYLVDVANLALLEFEEGIHYRKHFSSIDDGEHVKEKQ